MEEIKTISSDGDLIYSKSIIVSKKNPNIEIKGGFELKINFETEPLLDENGETKPKSSHNIDDCLFITFFNFFQFKEPVRYTTKNYFFRSHGEKMYRNYYLSLVSQLLTKNKESLLVTINISKRDFPVDIDDDVYN